MANTANMTNMTNTMNIFKNLYRGAATLLAACAFAGNVYADDPVINIGGDVYGGGKQGAVGTANATAGIVRYTAEEAATENESHLVKDANNVEPEGTGYITTYEPGYNPVAAGDINESASPKTGITVTKVNPTETVNGTETNVAMTNVQILDGKIRTVFGGGENGRVYGATSVTVNGANATIGHDEWAGTIHGGVFGAGDGASAVVFGHDLVTIKNGTIYNNVYGGGNQADLIGSTSVILQGGNIFGDVYGGARMADIMGHSYVNIDGANAANNLFVKAVYGGNDIAGSIRVKTNEEKWTWLASTTIATPFTTEAKTVDPNTITIASDGYFSETTYNDPKFSENDAIDKLWNAFVQSTPVKSGIQVFVGNLFGGGNGDYTYTKVTEGFTVSDLYDGTWDATLNDGKGGVAKSTNPVTFTVDNKPLLAKTYLQIKGGTFGYVYGGGNQATVTASTDIYINNADAPCVGMTKEVVERMGLQTSSYTLNSAGTEAVFAQTIDRVFGGNNFADMDIQPNWYLLRGRVNNLYSGGNQGDMTCKDGIFVNVFKNQYNADDPNCMMINNLYGGCRMSDVVPKENGAELTSMPAINKFGYDFKPNYAARVYVSGGTINNVYGGNDISGHVKLGTDVEIHGAVSGDIYGGGNGAYPYTDNKALAEAFPDKWRDYYYDTEGKVTLNVDGTIAGTECTSSNSLDGLNKKRPHVAQSLVHIAGVGRYIAKDKWESKYGTDIGAVVKVDKDGEKTTGVGQLLGKGEMLDVNRVYVTGGVYCGGNSATLKSESSTGTPTATLQIGQCVTIDKVFLGSNGERMVAESLLEQYAAANVDGKGKLARFNLTNSDDMQAYMKGCAVDIMPNITYDNEDRKFTAENLISFTDPYDDKHPGSERIGEEIDVSVDENADMDSEGLNFSTRIGSFFCGGNVGSMTMDGLFDKEFLKFPRELVIFDKVVAGCNNANVPYRNGLNAFYAGGVTGTPDTNIKGDATDPGLKIRIYVPCRFEPRQLVTEIDDAGYVHIVTKDKDNKAVDPEPWSAPIVFSDYGIESDKIGPVQILDRGNIYGGCYASGHVNGSVEIQIKDELCATAQMRAYFGDKPFIGQAVDQDGTAQVVDNMRRYVLNHGWSAFGGGYGKETEIWGNVYMNLDRNAGYINAYGGSQLGFIGKIQRDVNGIYQTETVDIKTTREPTDEERSNSAASPITTPIEVTQTINKYVVEQAGNTYVSLGARIHRSPVSIFGLNAIYGGGYQGIVTGDTHMYAGGGLHYDVFGGACNADIYGSTEVFVGKDRDGNFDNNLQLRHCVYGGNDFGGQVLGTKEHTVNVNGTNQTVTSNTFVQYLGGTIERSILGGSCGLYRYEESYKLTADDLEEFKGKQVMVGDNLLTSTEIAALKAGDEIRLYPDKSSDPLVHAYETLPTLYANLGGWDDAKTTKSNANSYNAVVDIACQEDFKPAEGSTKVPNTILGNVYGGGYGFCDDVARVDMRDSYVVLHGPKSGTTRLADNVYAGGYFSYVENSTLEAVSGQIRTAIFGGTYGTTVDERIAEQNQAKQKADADNYKTQWGSTIPLNSEEYTVLHEVALKHLQNADYTSHSTKVNVYSDLVANQNLDVYGAGDYTGADNTEVNLLGGSVREVYGGSNREGVCLNTVVNVPATSTINMKLLFGGSHGSSPALPCDVRNAVVNFNSSLAVVADSAVFGGNNAYRATRNATIYYDAKAKDVKGNYLTLYGAGNGVGSVAGNTNVFVSGNSIVTHVYGGGNAGQVFAKYDILKSTGTPTTKPTTAPSSSASQTEKDAYSAALADYYAWNDATDYDRYKLHSMEQTKMSYGHWYLTEEPHHTFIQLADGAQVMGSVFGAGRGETSNVVGKTFVECNGATVAGDIFGGGYAGNVRKMLPSDTGYPVDGEGKPVDYELAVAHSKTTNPDFYVATNIDMNGGQVRNIFGGGYAGVVGGTYDPSYDPTGTAQPGNPTALYDYTTDTDLNEVLKVKDYTAQTNVNIGTEYGKPVADASGNQPGEKDYIPTYAALTHSWGEPNIAFSVYGAGDRGAVFGDSRTTMYNGYVGYDYRKYTAAELAAMSDAERVKYNSTDSYYIERLKANDTDTKNLMKEDGNVYGGGFGEEARVRHTVVTLYNGQIRNSLYGGGEMSAVGWGFVRKDTETNELVKDKISQVGSTFVEMYGGKVNNDVFGGGRGYSYDNNGEMMYGTKYMTDGFIFGKTDVNIYRGTIGTDESIKEANGAHGNVFGGGNIGYVYSGDGEPAAATTTTTTEAITKGYYYNQAGKLTEDTRVNVTAYGKSKVDNLEITYDVVYHPGFTVPNIIMERMRADLALTTPNNTYSSWELVDAEGGSQEVSTSPITGFKLSDYVDQDNRAIKDFQLTDNTPFMKDDYIPNEALNVLTNIDTRWASIDDSGITIRNAVFGGGNVSKGSDKVYAFANTVFGNSTASIVDVFCRDLIDVGKEGLGGLYGDGNLTFVAGYRELNVTNYGTDYFSLPAMVDFSTGEGVSDYEKLTARQKAFYIAKYMCNNQIILNEGEENEITYRVGEIILSDEFNKLPQEYQTINGTNETDKYWTQTEAIINEGRYLNTLQRADYCGLKGSRLVMKGAMDRAQVGNTEVDFTEYTINRVGEISLNQCAGKRDNNKSIHGSYFGIYNVVKYLGSMSSDKSFVTGLSDPESGIEASAVRTTNSTKAEDAVNGQTFFEWKIDKYNLKNRNNGTSPNKVALASGVYLELVREPEDESKATTKDYGPIIGVVELDLLNVTPGEGGGFVYAENNHGKPTFSAEKSYASVLSDANYHLKTCRAYSYDNSNIIPEYNGVETSGNFVHSSKRIVDDCFPVAGNLNQEVHYWYLKGDFYVYDQLISAYTGNAATYNSELNIPLDINGKINPKLRLQNVLPGLYASPAAFEYDYRNEKSDSLDIIFNGVIKRYGQNDPISYWDWYNIPTASVAKLQDNFVLQTYTCREDVTVGGTTYHRGQAILPAAYAELDGKTGTDAEGKSVDAQSMFNLTNAVDKEHGFLLTLDMSNPTVWDDNYILIDEKQASTTLPLTLTTAEWNKLDATIRGEYINVTYAKSATFKCKDNGVYGQATYGKGDIVSKLVYDSEAAVEEKLTADQIAALTPTLAKFEAAYVTTDSCDVVYTSNSETKTVTLNAGYPMSKTFYESITSVSGIDKDGKPVTSKETLINRAYICVSTIEVASKEYIYLNQIVSETDYNSKYYGKSYNDKTLGDKFSLAYYCVGGYGDNTGGSWGGNYFEAGKNYSGVEVCKAIVDTKDTDKDERKHFSFNYDALDLLVANYNPYNGADAISLMKDAGTTYNDKINTDNLYDGENAAGEALRQLYQNYYNLDVTAEYTGATPFNYYADGGATSSYVTISATGANKTLNGVEYETLPNERTNYVKFAVTSEDWDEGHSNYVKYIVKETFEMGGNLYRAGSALAKADYDKLKATASSKIDVLTIPTDNVVSGDANSLFYCITPYKVGEKNGYVGLTTSPSFTSVAHDAVSATTYAVGNEVPSGTIIHKTDLDAMANYQKDFSLTGKSPMEEVTLYVPANANINDLLEDRYVTAIFDYQYSELADDGYSYETYSEKHIINVRVKFMYGQPKIGPLNAPDLVLPKETITMAVPAIEEGAFPIISAGWMIFPTQEDAISHTNGTPFENGRQPLYWYQNDYYIEYYASTVMGPTYSAPEQLRVANYHRLSEVLNDGNHLFIDHHDVDRNPKIYIDNRTFDIKGQEAVPAATGKNELEALKELFALTNSEFGTEGQKKVDSNGKIILQNHGRDLNGCNGLDFFIQSDVEETKPWTPIGDGSSICFNGNVHGNGHAISGLDNSLFNSLCGSVYNLGIMGTFTTSGLALSGSGRAENCWVWSTGKPSSDTKAVMGSIDATENKPTVVNCYYPETMTSETSKFVEGTGVVARPVADFLNGQVAYDLNRFYLEARYLQGSNDATGTVENLIIKRLPDGTIEKTALLDEHNQPVIEDGDTIKVARQYAIKYLEADAPYQGYYMAAPTTTEGSPTPLYYGYVERLYEDGDFRYADGLKPKTADMREVATNDWLPIFPDDYIFFGQKLSYKLYSYDHDLHPMAAVKEKSVEVNKVIDNSKNGLLTSNPVTTNRIYRAPAYFRDSKYGKSAIFNSTAAFRRDINVAKIAEPATPEDVVEIPENVIPWDGFMIEGTYYPHKDMTSVDFTGANEIGWQRGLVAPSSGSASSKLKKAGNTYSVFYPPLLDFNYLDDIRVDGLTRNLTVYGPYKKTKVDPADNTQIIDDTDQPETKTYNVISGYFTEPSYNDYLDIDPNGATDGSYFCVDVYEAPLSIKGHAIAKNGENYIAYTDHYLVDKEDFNAPIAYNMYGGINSSNTIANGAKVMWYQRKPDNYAEKSATNVSTGWEGVSIPFAADLVSTQDKGEITHFYSGNDQGKVGHEYWLRSYEKKVSEDAGVVTASFIAPVSDNSYKPHGYYNTFLYDYYYSQDEFKDKNEDEYQKYYKYRSSGGVATYDNYPTNTAGVPYVAGFPGETYYEFDLSGKWKPEYRVGDKTIEPISAQTISFVSAAGAPIGVSDTELAAGTTAEGGYAFVPNYLNDKVAQSKGYVLASDGGSFDVVAEANGKAVYPFRPYFVPVSSSGAKPTTRSIVIGDAKESMFDVEERQKADAADGGLTVRTKRGGIVITSNLKDDTRVRVLSASGITIATFSIEPGETRIVPINAPGIYLVNNKKFTVNN